jgi:hypothetical protein
MTSYSRRSTEPPPNEAELLDLLALASSLIATLNTMEHRMHQLQAPDPLYRYVRAAHGLSTRLQGRLLDAQGRATLVALVADYPPQEHA